MKPIRIGHNQDEYDQKQLSLQAKLVRRLHAADVAGLEYGPGQLGAKSRSFLPILFPRAELIG